MKYQTAFTRRKCYVAWIAVWERTEGSTVIVGAPSLEKLATDWADITGGSLVKEHAQRVTFVSTPPASE